MLYIFMLYIFIAVFKWFEPKSSRMHFWQDADKCKDRTLKYQSENINKPGRKRKLSLMEEFFIVLVKLKTFIFFLLNFSERFDVFVSLISKTYTTWIIFWIMSCHYVFLFLHKNFYQKAFTEKLRKQHDNY